MVRTFYDVLEVPPSATAEDIEAAYRERLKDTHPDLNGEESTTEAVKIVIAAGDVLTDADERRRYDRLGHETYVAVTDTDDPAEPGTASADPTAQASSPSSNTDAVDQGTVTDPGGPSRRPSDTDTVDAGNVNPEGVSWASVGTAPSHEPSGPAEYAGPRSERSILFLSSLIAYPILVLASTLSPFPVPFRLLLGVCATALVIYLVSVPVVSIPVFGFWTLVAAVVIALSGIPVFSVTCLGAIVVTAGPLGLAVVSARRP